MGEIGHWTLPILFRSKLLDLSLKNLCLDSRHSTFSLEIVFVFRWRASLWKTVWRELLVYLGLYMAISLIYR